MQKNRQINNQRISLKVCSLLFIGLWFACHLSAQSYTFDTRGDYIVPVTQTGTLTVNLKGGPGQFNFFNNPSLGGTGAELTANFLVQDGDVLLVVVGGYGAVFASGGGGSALILRRGTDTTLLIVAGAGGGGGQGNFGKGGIAADGVSGGGAGGVNGGAGGGGGFNHNGTAGVSLSSSPGGNMGTLSGGGASSGHSGSGFGSGGSGGVSEGGGGGGYGGGDGGDGLRGAGHGGTSYVETGGLNGFVGTNITRINGIDGMGTQQDGFVILSGVMLPVEMTYFKASRKSSMVALEWATASEEMNEGFQVERSNDGKRWNPIDFIEGSGTTFEKSKYTFFDENPLVGMNYYRLKQIDFDGGFEYSDIVNIEFDNLESSVILIYPNPVQGKLIIESDAELIIIYNALGQPVITRNNNKSKLEINTSDLEKGIYFLKLQQQNGKMIHRQFIKD